MGSLSVDVVNGSEGCAMSFVKSPAGLAEIARLATSPRFVSGQRLTVEYLTDPEAVRRILPPPLEPADRPLVIVGVGQWRNELIGDYAGGSVYVAARHDGVDGVYGLTMWMDTEESVAYGREVFGEPKTLGTLRLSVTDEEGWATVERHGVQLVSLTAELGPDLGPSESDGVAYNFRSRTAPDGGGLDGPATLTRADFHVSASSQRVGTGTVVLRGTPGDPLDELPVRSVVRAVSSANDIVGTCRAVASVPAADFLPFHHGRNTNWLATDRAR